MFNFVYNQLNYYWQTAIEYCLRRPSAKGAIVRYHNMSTMQMQFEEDLILAYIMSINIRHLSEAHHAELLYQAADKGHLGVIHYLLSLPSYPSQLPPFTLSQISWRIHAINHSLSFVLRGLAPPATAERLSISSFNDSVKNAKAIFIQRKKNYHLIFTFFMDRVMRLSAEEQLAVLKSQYTHIAPDYKALAHNLQRSFLMRLSHYLSPEYLPHFDDAISKTLFSTQIVAEFTRGFSFWKPHRQLEFFKKFCLLYALCSNTEGQSHFGRDILIHFHTYFSVQILPTLQAAYAAGKLKNIIPIMTQYNITFPLNEPAHTIVSKASEDVVPSIAVSHTTPRTKKSNGKHKKHTTYHPRPLRTKSIASTSSTTLSDEVSISHADSEISLIKWTGGLQSKQLCVLGNSVTQKQIHKMDKTVTFLDPSLPILLLTHLYSILSAQEFAVLLVGSAASKAWSKRDIDLQLIKLDNTKPSPAEVEALIYQAFALNSEKVKIHSLINSEYYLITVITEMTSYDFAISWPTLSKGTLSDSEIETIQRSRRITPRANILHLTHIREDGKCSGILYQLGNGKRDLCIEKPIASSNDIVFIWRDILDPRTKGIENSQHFSIAWQACLDNPDLKAERLKAAGQLFWRYVYKDPAAYQQGIILNNILELEPDPADYLKALLGSGYFTDMANHFSKITSSAESIGLSILLLSLLPLVESKKLGKSQVETLFSNLKLDPMLAWQVLDNLNSEKNIALTVTDHTGLLYLYNEIQTLCRAFLCPPPLAKTVTVFKSTKIVSPPILALEPY
ncbi:MAG: hypothetical protein Q7V63_05190 [Gammaproteobacteria bacterium]|nr:hypothetical protein [Gammaproteobacteria bacterium]